MEIIKEKRKLKGYTINDMATSLGLTNASMYYKREAGQYKFKAEEVMMVARLLEIPMDKLFLSDQYSKIDITGKKQII
ncbi:helix-turn-helix domain-containing protein [Lentibacillus sp. JNUCC-1]|uniref:helix-turn-helix domain-containing protein n=1 Tax=Lentibacillus sp. JNUCC-1 TaxID=2654513 RepID=UPI0018D26AF0|nr:helix-turn-helix transcriptional regulator [Lentibacillus sp. JNUCC-1]